MSKFNHGHTLIPIISGKNLVKPKYILEDSTKHLWSKDEKIYTWPIKCITSSVDFVKKYP